MGQQYTDGSEREVHADPLIGKVIQGRYRLISRLGEGGMAVVYVAEHVSVGRRFALKLLDPAQARDAEAIERFRREARAAAAIGDEHIVEIVDMGVLDIYSPYMVMELLEGRDLDKELKAHQGPFPISRAVEIATQCCHALGEAHKRGIVHRDIKPENIFLTKTSQGRDFVKILDFGVSKILEAAVDLRGQPLTASGFALGTPHYMSPEQLYSEKEIDGRADVYSMGVVLFQMLIGRVPFDAASYPALAMKIVNHPPPSMLELRSDIPVELQHIVFRALAKNPTDRFPSTEELAKALSSFSGYTSAALLTGSGVEFNRGSTPTAWEKRAWSTTMRFTGPGSGIDMSSTQLAGGKPRETWPAGASKDKLNIWGAIAVLAIGGLLFGVFLYQKGATAKARNYLTPARTMTTLLPATEGAEVAPLPSLSIQKTPVPVFTPERQTVQFPTPVEQVKITPGDDGKDTIEIAGRKTSGVPITKQGAVGQTRPVAALTPAKAKKRAVLLRNTIRADVKVAINCGGARTARRVLANNETLATVPQKTCQVSCTGVGKPICPAELSPTASSLEIL
jgi:serine/threonine protein kinase